MGNFPKSIQVEYSTDNILDAKGIILLPYSCDGLIAIDKRPNDEIQHRPFVEYCNSGYSKVGTSTALHLKNNELEGANNIFIYLFTKKKSNEVALVKNIEGALSDVLRHTYPIISNYNTIHIPYLAGHKDAIGLEVIEKVIQQFIRLLSNYQINHSIYNSHKEPIWRIEKATIYKL